MKRSTRYWKKIKWWAEDWWFWYQAMQEAADHTIKGHTVAWEWDDLWCGHGPCVTCVECPDTSIEDGKHVGLTIWCSHSMLRMWFGQRLCGMLGHPLFQHPKTGDVYVEDQVYCYRCSFESKLQKVWQSDAQGQD